MSFILIFILAFLPAVFWFFIFLREDRADPEPKKLLIKLFVLGAFSGFIAGAVEIGILELFPSQMKEEFNILFDQTGEINLTLGLIIFFILSILVFAILEEIIKIASVRWAVYNHTHFNQIVDGAIFGVSAGLGFATLENFFYFIETNTTEGLGSLVIVFTLRFFATTLLHALATGMAGYYLGKAKFLQKPRIFWIGLLSASLVHAVFNLSLFAGVFGLLFVIIILVTVFVFMIRKMGSVEAQTIWGLVLLKQRVKKPPLV